MQSKRISNLSSSLLRSTTAALIWSIVVAVAVVVSRTRRQRRTRNNETEWRQKKNETKENRGTEVADTLVHHGVRYGRILFLSFLFGTFSFFFFFSPSTSSTSRRCRRRRRRDVIETEKKSKEINIKRTSFFLKSFLAIDRYDRLSIDIEARRRRCRRRRRRDVIETEKKWKKSTTKNNRS